MKLVITLGRPWGLIWRMAAAGVLGLSAVSGPVWAEGDGGGHNYPTSVRMEYVQECMNLNGGAFVLMYQCSCVLDRMAEKYPLDDFIEAGTFVKYATLGGERGAEFRDFDRARDLVRKFRSDQASAYKACNVQSQPRPR